MSERKVRERGAIVTKIVIRESEKEALKDPGNIASDYDRLTKHEKAILQEWINSSFELSKAIGPRPVRGSLRHLLGFGIPTSYTLKHWFEDSKKGFYITNGQFKGAMLAIGHQPTENTRSRLNWRFKIKMKR